MVKFWLIILIPHTLFQEWSLYWPTKLVCGTQNKCAIIKLELTTHKKNRLEPKKESPKGCKYTHSLTNGRPRVSTLCGSFNSIIYDSHSQSMKWVYRHNEESWYGVLTGVGDKLGLHLLYSPLSSFEQWSFTFYYN